MWDIFKYPNPKRKYIKGKGIKAKSFEKFEPNLTGDVTNKQIFNAGFNAAWKHQGIKIAILQRYIMGQITLTQLETAINKHQDIQYGIIENTPESFEDYFSP